MEALRVTPILNVSDFSASVLWFEKLGWTKQWDWGNPPRFGGVYSGDCEIFLCENLKEVAAKVLSRLPSVRKASNPQTRVFG